MPEIKMRDNPRTPVKVVDPATGVSQWDFLPLPVSGNVGEANLIPPEVIRELQAALKNRNSKLKNWVAENQDKRPEIDMLSGIATIKKREAIQGGMAEKEAEAYARRGAERLHKIRLGLAAVGGGKSAMTVGYPSVIIKEAFSPTEATPAQFLNKFLPEQMARENFKRNLEYQNWVNQGSPAEYGVDQKIDYSVVPPGVNPYQEDTNPEEVKRAINRMLNAEDRTS